MLLLSCCGFFWRCCCCPVCGVGVVCLPLCFSKQKSKDAKNAMCHELTAHPFPTQIPLTVCTTRVRSYCSHCRL